jgi:putative endonuclease
VNKRRNYFVYILRCSDGSLYTGWTTDVAARVEQHSCKQGAKYTRSRLPIKLVHQERLQSQRRAMQREHEIKWLSRAEKLRLVRRHG